MKTSRVFMSIAFVKKFLTKNEKISRKIELIVTKCFIWIVFYYNVTQIIKWKYFFLHQFQSVLPWRIIYYFVNCRNLWIFERVSYGFYKKKKQLFLILACVLSKKNTLQQNNIYLAKNIFLSFFRFFYTFLKILTKDKFQAGRD